MVRSKWIPTALVLCLGWAGVCFAQTLSLSPIHTSAEIANEFSLGLTFLDASTGQLLPEMNFGTLEESEGALAAQRSVKVLVAMRVNGSPYSLTQISSPLTREGGDETIPPQALTVRPFYETPLNGNLDMPNSARLASPGAASSVQTIYSDPTGQGRTLSVLYSLNSDPANSSSKIPQDQRGGSYAGTVQFTLTPS